MENDRAVSEAVQAVAEGARTIKAKTGLDPRRDIELVRMLREALGPNVRIRVDADEGYYSASEAIRITRAMEPYDIAFTEQPVADLEDMAVVARQVDVPVMADEGCTGYLGHPFIK